MIAVFFYGIYGSVLVGFLLLIPFSSVFLIPFLVKDTQNTRRALVVSFVADFVSLLVFSIPEFKNMAKNGGIYIVVILFYVGLPLMIGIVLLGYLTVVAYRFSKEEVEDPL